MGRGGKGVIGRFRRHNIEESYGEKPLSGPGPSKIP